MSEKQQFIKVLEHELEKSEVFEREMVMLWKKHNHNKQSLIVTIDELKNEVKKEGGKDE